LIPTGKIGTVEVVVAVLVVGLVVAVVLVAGLVAVVVLVVGPEPMGWIIGRLVKSLFLLDLQGLVRVTVIPNLIPGGGVRLVTLSGRGSDLGWYWIRQEMMVL
jgi:hypothetical protein